MLLSAIVQFAMLSATAPPPGDTTYTIAANGSVISADTVQTVADAPEIARWPDKKVYRPGEEVLVAAHFTGGGYVVDHRVGDSAPVPEVLAWTDRPQYDVGEAATVYVQTGSVPGYVMVFQVDDDGTGHILFPRTPKEDNYIRADQTIALAGTDDPEAFAVTSASGTGLLYAVISRDHFDLSQLQDANGWRSDAIRIDASPSAASSGDWGRLFWAMKDVAKGVNAGSFNSHLLSYRVVNPRAARNRLFAPVGFYDPDLFAPLAQAPCGFINNLPLFGEVCDWLAFELQFAADRAAWCAETHNPVSCADGPTSIPGTKIAGPTPPAHHLGDPFGPKPITQSVAPPALGGLASAFHPAVKPPPAEPPTYATGVSHPKSGASPPHAVDPGFAPPRTTAERPEQPRSTGAGDRSTQSQDRGTHSAPSSNGGGNNDASRSNGAGWEPQQSSGGGGGNYQPASQSGGGWHPDPAPSSPPPSYSPPDRTNAGNPPGSPPPAPGRPPAD
jgi:hypothetical protein